jgi:hypothetical protein
MAKAVELVGRFVGYAFAVRCLILTRHVNAFLQSHSSRNAGACVHLFPPYSIKQLTCSVECCVTAFHQNIKQNSSQVICCLFGNPSLQGSRTTGASLEISPQHLAETLLRKDAVGVNQHSAACASSHQKVFIF